ncbi:cytochrome P450 [Microbacterium sp. SSW1-49]|uniref:Cytochrome P450 n=1 Tax=Microbacterium croceum TaxID=2851645 RepID=A0ABT0FG41_9MICO|nr:cytochrome P450 [Microbacterium croceum]MCK2037028.1 cytochrome P450 [Microbacterium croceum]
MSDTGSGSLVEAAIAAPHAAYARLRGGGDVVWNDETGSWYVLSSALVTMMSRDDRLRARGVPAGVADLPPEEYRVVLPVEQFFARWLVFSDPPKQSLIRRSLAKNLTKTVLADLPSSLADQATSRLEALTGSGGDLYLDVILPLSLHTTQAILGTSDEDTSAILEATDAVMDYLATPGTDFDKAQVALVAIGSLSELVDRLAASGNRIALSLGELEQNGSIDRDDIVAAYAQVVTGAIEPLSSALASAAVAAIGNAPSADALPGFIEDVLRDHPPFHFAPRVAREDIELEGRSIRAGQRVVLNLLAANDDARCPVAHAGTAPAATGHHSFGSGTHYCLGSAVSRLHLQVVLERIIASGVLELISGDDIVMKPSFGAKSFGRIPTRSRGSAAESGVGSVA